MKFRLIYSLFMMLAVSLCLNSIMRFACEAEDSVYPVNLCSVRSFTSLGAPLAQLVEFPTY